MKEFKQLYGKDDKKKAAANFRNAILIYCAVALFFAAFCIVFVVLYVKIELSVYLCFALNFLVTVAFCWFSVIFFTAFFPEKRELLRFFKAFGNAEGAYARGAYLGENGEDIQAKVAYIRLEFLNGENKEQFFVLKGTRIPFVKGKTYDLQTLGNRITAYKEADNG